MVDITNEGISSGSGDLELDCRKENLDCWVAALLVLCLRSVGSRHEGNDGLTEFILRI